MHGDWDLHRIAEILPQTYPFLFIDKVIEADSEKGRVICVKNVSINEHFFQGHFPGTPIMPGALILEGLAQASIILYAILKPHRARQNPMYYLGKTEMKFSHPVRPGDTLFLWAERIKILDAAGIVQVKAMVKEEIVAEGRIYFGVKVSDV